jgi:hypothetical protein
MLRFGLKDRLFEENADAGGGSGAGAFDAAAFQTAIMAEVTKSIGAALKAYKPPVAAAATAAAKTETETAAAGETAKTRDPMVAALERQNKDLADRFKALEETNRATTAKAEEKERHAAIRGSLGDFQFASDDARDDAFRSFREDVKRGEDGELYGGDMVPLKDFIKTRMAAKTHLLAPKAVDSAGARANAGFVGGKQVQLEDIRSGMDTKTRDAAWAAVRAQVGAL